MATTLQNVSLTFIFSGGAVTALGVVSGTNIPINEVNPLLSAGLGLMGVGTILWSIDETTNDAFLPLRPEPKRTIKANGDRAMGLALMSLGVAGVSRFSRQWGTAGVILFVGGAAASIYGST
jgi:hypothetical protein